MLKRSTSTSSSMQSKGLALAVFVSGCTVRAAEDSAESALCCGPERSSVTISAVNQSGNANIDAVVDWSLDGAEYASAECARTASGGACVIWTAGVEQAGNFQVRATAPGYLPASEAVDVGLDFTGCHVDPQIVTLVLEPGEDNPPTE